MIENVKAIGWISVPDNMHFRGEKEREIMQSVQLANERYGGGLSAQL